MSIAIRNISKQFGAFKALDDVSIEIPSGELVALLGPSGCGKTTLLRIIAGLEYADQGQILLAGDDTSARHARDRQVGFVFQHYALFRHMSVFDNVAFGLRVKPRRYRPAEAEIRRRVKRLLELVQLDWLADRYPTQLSGGQRQRIALARALAVEPKVLLLDEPFGALDAKVRKELRRWLRQLHDEIHVTSVFVTHDQEEALEVSDRVVLINKGKVEQIGTPESVYDHPATPFVANFLGSVNLFHGRVEDGQLHLGEHQVGAADGNDGKAVAFVRPHEFELVPGWAERDGLPATIVRVVSVGPSAQIELSRSDGELVEVSIARDSFRLLGLGKGDQVLLRPRHIRVFQAEAQAA
ncbi:MAG: sulfate ABC transporter ATP-binding protein [Candidatus Accumulibacter phosphatis]|jgi:sulfate transport system ATP-binding protein|uniref:Sulfate ABC transporter ATP-binding protein n=1 Tax=Candidatus Accumulibacter contiguus TaxID=2954381 RepID=A0ABX1TBG0_9PROT|nr:MULTISPECIES: sulfate ABC transporter ATP-binding protein [Candidatus Accumulibacter]MBL8407751.1 sulfate ABC transporter ATP-binding protein [Accumulibacter sp.]NMQ06995.1 sulfate ABC transporter ATP-binding protein [Candidatus Accumulibacter contiguus]HRF11556.1 sulfate ABC transporter ATP-binding protein [Candidatus Accumulibacter phosphatis]